MSADNELIRKKIKSKPKGGADSGKGSGGVSGAAKRKAGGSDGGGGGGKKSRAA